MVVNSEIWSAYTNNTTQPMKKGERRHGGKFLREQGMVFRKSRTKCRLANIWKTCSQEWDAQESFWEVFS